MRRPISKAHAEALVLTKAKTVRIKTRLVAVVMMKQHGVERALQIYGHEEFRVPKLCDKILRAREGQTVFALLGVDTSHVNTQPGVIILFGGEHRVGSPRPRARLCDVCNIVFENSLMQQLLAHDEISAADFPNNRARHRQYLISTRK